MSMRLLPKSEVSKAQATVKKQEIDEGLKLARRIDALRETHASEEASLNKFRTETVTRIHKEIEREEQKLADVIKKRDDARDERKNLLKPLTKEWAEVEKAKKEALMLKEEAETRVEIAREHEEQVKEATKRASDTLTRALAKEERIDKALKEADDNQKESEQVLKRARDIEASAIKLKEDMEAELLHRDQALAMRESGVTIREEHLSNGESELAKGWKLLEDRKATFERAINRTKK
jgi:chromosome segregation ATPase